MKRAHEKSYHSIVGVDREVVEQLAVPTRGAAFFGNVKQPNRRVVFAVNSAVTRWVNCEELGVDQGVRMSSTNAVFDRHTFDRHPKRLTAAGTRNIRAFGNLIFDDRAVGTTQRSCAVVLKRLHGCPDTIESIRIAKQTAHRRWIRYALATPAL